MVVNRTYGYPGMVAGPSHMVAQTWGSKRSNVLAISQVLNPATEEPIASVLLAGAAETTQAIVCAQQALPRWRATTAKARSTKLKAWHAAMLEHQDDIVNIMVQECGKPVKEAQNEFMAGMASVDWYAEEAKRYADTELQPSDSHPLQLSSG